MIIPLRDRVTQRHADRSTMEGFSFGFFCDICGKEWRSARYAFNPGDFAAQADFAIFQMLWNDQHKAAQARASRDAAFEFNRCPECGRRVCKECFYLSETGISDICVDCLKKRQLRRRKTL